MTGSNMEKAPWYRGLTGYHWLVLVVACLGWSFEIGRAHV